MRYKAEVTNGDKLANKGMRLNPTVLPNSHVPLYFHERTDETIVTNVTFIEIYRFDNRYVLTERDIPDLNLFYDWFVLHDSPCDDSIFLLRLCRFFR